MIRKVTSFKHKARNDPMKSRSLIAIPFLSSAEGAKISGTFGRHVVVELEYDLRRRSYKRDVQLDDA